MTLGAIAEDRVVFEPELEAEERHPLRRDILVAIDHGPGSRHAFEWAIKELASPHDVVYLLHVLHSKPTGIEFSCAASPRVQGDNPVYDSMQHLMESLARQAFEHSKVRSVPKIVSGDVARSICAEAARLKPVAVVVGSRGLGLFQSVLQGSVSEYCLRNCSSPLVIVPNNNSDGTSSQHMTDGQEMIGKHANVEHGRH